MSRKEKLCQRFVGNPGDDIYKIVEQLGELEDKPCNCLYVYPSKKRCDNEASTAFGYCETHLKTKKGVELATLWNNTLKELGFEKESEESAEEESGEEESGEESDAEESGEESGEESAEEESEESEESEERTPVKRSLVRAPAPTAPRKLLPKKEVARAPPARAPVRRRIDGSEESSPAEGSGRAHYVDQESDEDVEVEVDSVPTPKRKTLQFKRSAFGNFVNEETGFVIRTKDHVVLGTENKKGGISKLTAEDKLFCSRNNLNYLE